MRIMKSTSIAKGTALAYAKGNLTDAYRLVQNADKVMALIACRNIQ